MLSIISQGDPKPAHYAQGLAYFSLSPLPCPALPYTGHAHTPVVSKRCICSMAYGGRNWAQLLFALLWHIQRLRSALGSPRFRFLKYTLQLLLFLLLLLPLSTIFYYHLLLI